MITLESIKKEWATLANIITYIRFCFSPLPSAIIFVGWNVGWLRWLAAVIFGLVALTDLVDGYYARKLNQVTDLGKMMDPIVDKVLVLATLFAMCWIDLQNTLILGMTIIIALREILVTWLRFAANKQGIVISANKLGKAKMLLQSITVFLLLMPPISDIMNYIIIGMIIFTLWITVLSGMVYVVKYLELRPTLGKK